MFLVENIKINKLQVIIHDIILSAIPYNDDNNTK